MCLASRYAYLSTGWAGCASEQNHHIYDWNAEWLDADYGVPSDEVCKETSVGSGVFVREWSRATVQMDCNKWEPSVKFKSDE